MYTYIYPVGDEDRDQDVEYGVNISRAALLDTRNCRCGTVRQHKR